MKKVVSNRFTIVTAFLTLLIVIFISSFAGSAYLANADSTEKRDFKSDTEGQTAEVLSYTDVFEKYYATVLEKTDGIDICTFEEFCDEYYLSGMDLPNYTQNVILCHQAKASADRLKDNSIDLRSMSSDGDYILSSVYYDVTPASVFKRNLNLGLFDFSSIKKGDIIYETFALNGIGHNAIISNLSKPSAKGNYIETIEAVLGGVQYGFLDDTRMVNMGVKILRFFRVSLTDEVRDQIVYFNRMQVGKTYFFDPSRANLSIDSNSWYCSELINASYNYVGWPLCNPDSSGGILPAGLLQGYLLNYLLDFETKVLDLSIEKKSGSKWTINVRLNEVGSLNVDYNSKMCYESDAKDWTKLKDLKNKTVGSGSQGVDFEISENWFATTIAFSYVSNNRRCITYADQLNNNAKTLRVRYNVL